MAATSGWRIHAFHEVGSTNDEAASLRVRGATQRCAVVADRQRSGRGRGGRTFASPAGGLYVSLLLSAEARDLPAGIVAATALAAAEACEAQGVPAVTLKWPNDLWIGRRKVGGLLLEAAGPGALVVVGIGINVERVPTQLPAAVRQGLTALADESPRAVRRGPLLAALLAAVDRRQAQLASPGSRTDLARAWAARLALRGEQVCWQEGGSAHAGRLVDGDLEGLEVMEEGRGRRHLRAEHVQDLRPRSP